MQWLANPGPDLFWAPCSPGLSSQSPMVGSRLPEHMQSSPASSPCWSLPFVYMSSPVLGVVSACNFLILHSPALRSCAESPQTHKWGLPSLLSTVGFLSLLEHLTWSALDDSGGVHLSVFFHHIHLPRGRACAWFLSTSPPPPAPDSLTETERVPHQHLNWKEIGETVGLKCNWT